MVRRLAPGRATRVTSGLTAGWAAPAGAAPATDRSGSRACAASFAARPRSHGFAGRDSPRGLAGRDSSRGLASRDSSRGFTSCGSHGRLLARDCFPLHPSGRLATRRLRLRLRLFRRGLFRRVRRRQKLLLLLMPPGVGGLLRERLLLHVVQHILALALAAAKLVVCGIHVDVPAHTCGSCNCGSTRTRAGRWPGASRAAPSESPDTQCAGAPRSGLLACPQHVRLYS